MTKYCVIPEEVRYDIEMELYFRYNDSFCKMYDYLGEIYTLKDIRELKKIEKEDRKWMISDYLEGKRLYSEEQINWIHNYLYGEK